MRGWSESGSMAPGGPTAGASVAADSGRVCPPRTTLCSEYCVDEQTDNGNCGGCTLHCDDTCSNGHCLVTLASGLREPIGIAVDRTSVYVTEFIDGGDGGDIISIPLSGGTPTTLASGQSIPVPGDIAVDAASVYWLNAGAVMSVPLGGGLPITLASGQLPGRLALDSTGVYFSSASTPGSISVVPLLGGPAGTLATGYGPFGIAVDSTSVYWTQGLQLIRTPKAGGGPSVTLTSEMGGGGIAVDRTSVYGISGTTSQAIAKVPLDSGVPVTLAVRNDELYVLAKFVVNENSVYWPEVNDGTIMKVDVNGGTLVTLVSGLNFPFAIAVDDTSVYWTDQFAQTVMKVTPK